MSQSPQRPIEVWADWHGLGGPAFMGTLRVTPGRGKEIFSFEYDPAWLSGPHLQNLDPDLRLFAGVQYTPANRDNFGLFLDSSPDRWGRVLMRRREAQLAREEQRPEKQLLESDFLLGVHDGHRMGALRFRTTPDGPFLDNNHRFASPPWTSLRELENACLQLEREDAFEDPDYARWLQMLIAPGGSLGGARPKASVVDTEGQRWIAKFPSRRDGEDTGAWEGVVHELASRANLTTPQAQVRQFASPHHTFLSQRFDRTPQGGRIHFASAMTLLQKTDGDDAASGTSYLELAEFLVQSGAHPNRDLEELWRRIVFSLAVSNTDDHLRNHGFLLEPEGWALAPAYDMNPNPQGNGLKLNISETDNSLDFDLALQVAPFFRVADQRAKEILAQIKGAVARWPEVAATHGIPSAEQSLMSAAFRLTRD